MQVDVGQQRARYTPYKVANLVLEFSTSIPRTQLRPGYGDGFLGAPLHVVPAINPPYLRSKETVVARRAYTPRQMLEVRIVSEPGHNVLPVWCRRMTGSCRADIGPLHPRRLPTTQAGQLRPEQPVRRRDPA